MRHVAAIERTGFAFGVAGLLTLCGSLAWVAVPVSSGSGGGRGGVEAVVRRLDAAAVARGAARRDDQFDAVIGSLLAGIGSDTPTELAPAFEMIRRGREHERQSAAHRGAAAAAAQADPDVERGLALAERTLGRLEAEASPSRMTRGLATFWVASGAVLTAVGLVGLWIAQRARREERRSIGALCACAPADVHAGRLGAAVGRRLALSRVSPPALAAEVVGPALPEHERGATAGVGDGEATLFGRILEIAAVNE